VNLNTNEPKEFFFFKAQDEKEKKYNMGFHVRTDKKTAICPSERK
jgi:hypothetical protein